MKAKFKVIADKLNVRKSPSLVGEKINHFEKGEIVQSIEKSADGEWLMVEKKEIKGWVSFKYLKEYKETEEDIKYAALFNAVITSAIIKIEWKGRGKAAIGYYKGMALVFARIYCKLKSGDAVAIEMSKANTGNTIKDALAYYNEKFKEAGMNNDTSGIDTLRHLFVLLFGLGMQESSGKYCEGRDMNAKNTKAETAEAGLFQTSYNAISAHPLLPSIFTQYKNNPDGFEDVFKEGVTCSDSNWKNYGDGNGELFQRLSKKCPAFAVEFACVALRNVRSHWGPLNNYHVEIKPEFDTLLLQIQQIVDKSNSCPI